MVGIRSYWYVVYGNAKSNCFPNEKKGDIPDFQASCLNGISPFMSATRLDKLDHFAGGELPVGIDPIQADQLLHVDF